MPTTTTEAEFQASDLIGSAGVGANGEKLISTLFDFYPPALQAAQLKRTNDELTAGLDDKARAQIADIAGVSEIADAVVAGGDRAGDEAVVRYAWLDENGAVWKGCFPYRNLKSGSSDGHVSQRDSLSGGTAAADQRRTRDYAGKAPGDVERDVQSAADPAEALEELSAADTVKLMQASPERAEAIKAFEEASRGERARKSVMEWEPDEGEHGDDQT